MKKIWKRSLSLFLAFVMVFGMLPVSAFADETEPVITEETSVTEPVAAEAAEIPVEETTVPVTEPPVVETTVPVTEPPVVETTVPVTEPPVAETTVPVTEPPVVETTVPVTEASEDAPKNDAKEVTDALTSSAVTTEETEASEPEETESVPLRVRTVSSVPSGAVPSNDELFTGYANHAWFGTDIATFGTNAGNQLNASTKPVYEALVPQLKAIANGERTSAMIKVGSDLSSYYGSYYAPDDPAAAFDLASDFDLNALLDALLADMPYDLYWYDKTVGTYCEIYSNPAGTQYLGFFYFTVASQYNNGVQTTFIDPDTNEAYRDPMYCDAASDKITLVQSTTSAALAVVNDVAADSDVKTDYDKLLAYKDWICDNTDYNDAAAKPDYDSEITDPWQLIYVFDGDPSTQVVCEGYSKAFQYLCDLTDFTTDSTGAENVTCYSVTGDLVDEGAHMWNIVEIEGNHYLADITNSDAGTVGENGSLFLVGGTADTNGVYTFSTINGSTAGFQYDEDTQDLWKNSGILTLAESNYEPPVEEEPDVTEPVEGMTQDQLEADLAAASDSYVLSQSFTLERDLAIDIEQFFEIPADVTLTVPSGKKLTLEGTIMISGELVLEDGAELILGSSERPGTIYIFEGTFTIGGSAVLTFANEYSSVVLDKFAEKSVINGTVPTEYLVTQYYARTEAQLQNALTAEDGARGRNIYVQANVVLTQPVTVREEDSISVQNGNTLTISSGVTVTNNGIISVYYSTLENNGTIENNGYIGGMGTYTGTGTITGTPHEIQDAENPTMTQAEFEEKLASCNGWFSLEAEVVIESGTVTIPEDVVVWVQTMGALTVSEGATLIVNGQLSTTDSSITINGTLINNNSLTIGSNGTNGRITIGQNGRLENNNYLSIMSGTFTIDGTYTDDADGDNVLEGHLSWDALHAQIVGEDKLASCDVSCQMIVYTEEELIAALEPMEGISNQTVSIGQDITLTSSQVIHSGINVMSGYSYNSSSSVQHQYGLTLAEGVTLTNYGSIYVDEHHYLIIEEGATLVNYNWVSIDGKLVKNGTIEGNRVNIYESGVLEVPEMTQAEFAAAVAEAQAAGIAYNLNANVTLTSDMTITNTVFVKQGASLTVAGGTLTVSGGLAQLVANGGTITIKDGAKLDISGGLAQLWGGGTLTFEDGADMSGIQADEVWVNMTEGTNSVNLTDDMLGAIFNPNSAADIEAAFAQTDTYAHIGIWPINDLKLEHSITIPAGDELCLVHNVTLTVPAGQTIINNGHIRIDAENRLEILKDGALVNNGSIHVNRYGQLYYYKGTLTNSGSIEGNGDIVTSESSHQELMDVLAECTASGSSWVHESETTLDPNVNGGVLQISMGGGDPSPEFYLVEGGVLRVPSDTCLEVYNPLIVREGGKVIIEEGGKLIVNGLLSVEGGTVYIAGNFEEGENSRIEGHLTFAGDTDPWLSETWLDNREEGWYWPEENIPHEVHGLHVMDCHWRIFFLNTWDAENLVWNAVPVIPTEVSEYMTITPIAEMEGHTIRGDQEYAEYFVCVDVFGTLESQNVNLFVDGNPYPYELFQRNVAFYNAPVVSMDTIITGGNHSMNGETEEEAVYWLVKEPEYYDVLNFSWNLETWGEDYTQYTGGDPLVTLDETQAEQGIYKFVIDPDYVEYTKFNWKNFNLQVHTDLDNNGDGNTDENWDRDLWINPAPQAEPQAHLRINDQTYLIFENDIIYRDYFTGDYDEWGNEIWDREKCSLPDGVAYELDNNKLLLTGGANLESLELAYLDCWEDENGYHEEQRLPSADLSLVVYGENSIRNDSECAMTIRNGTNVNISGTGSLYLYAKNSPDNVNEEGNRYAYPTVRIDGGSSLTISGSVAVTAEVDGSGFHGDIPAQMSAIDGYSEDPATGNSLTIRDDAVLTIVTPEGARTLDESKENYGNTRGIVSVSIEVNDNATLNTGSIYLWDGVDFTMNGGTVNLDPIGEVFYHPRLEDYYISRLGIYLEHEDSIFTLNDGTINIHAEPDEADHNAFCRAIFQGISAPIGDVNINGGLIELYGNGNDGGSGIAVQCAWDENGKPVEGLPTGNLYLTGGTVNIYADEGTEHEGIYVSALSDAAFSGGTVNAAGSTHYIEGSVDWTGNTQLHGNTHVLDGAEIVVKSGATLTIYNTCTVEEGGRIIVEDGGILDIQEGLTISDGGTVYIRRGGDVNYGEGHWLNGRITWEGDTAPYLTSTWLDNYDEGWYMNDEFFEENGLMSMEEHWRIFFLNTWDENELVWNCEPVVPTVSSEYMTITRVVDMEDQHIREDQEYAEYFVCVNVFGTIDRQALTLNANGYSIPFEVHERHTGFFRTTEFTLDSIIPGHDFVLDTKAGENAIYWLVRDAENYNIVYEEFNYRTWNDEDYSDYITGEDLIVLDDSRKDEGIYKITVDPGFVDYVQYDWKNFEIQVNMTLDYSGDDEIHEEPSNGGLWVNPPELLDPAAGLFIDNTDYMIFESGRIFRDVFAGYNDQGHEIWKRQETSLPAGVSYILSENRLILDGADLTSLHLNPSASGTDENGNFWEVYGLPNENLTISLVSNSIIENHCGPAVMIEHGMNVTVTGNGSLYAKTTNYSDYRDENGELQCFNTINVHGGSSLTIGGNATVTAELSGHGYWGSGEGATCHPISGSYEGDALKITDNATVTTVLPNGVRRYDNSGRTSQIGGYVGIQNFNTITISGGTLNTDHLNFYNGGQFNLTGGTVNFKDIGGINKFVNNEGVEMVESHYEGINMRGGSVNISGGTLNIDVTAREDETVDIAGFYGINVVNGTMDVTGGEINITANTDGWAILADCEWTEEGWVDDTGSTLNVTGGTIHVNNADRTYHGGILVSEICSAYFGGGEIHDDYGIHRFYGNTNWGDSENGSGTVLTGTAANVYTHGPGSFYMYGGQMNLTGDTFEDNGETITNRAIFQANAGGTLFGGTISLTNGTYINNMSLTLDGGEIIVHNNIADMPGLENNLYFPINSGTIDITANGVAIVNSGTFHQMGGTVTATNTSGSKPVMISSDSTLLNNGSLNLYGNGGVGLVQAYNFDLAADDIEDNESMLFVGPMDAGQYPSLNISGTQIGLYVNGPAAIMEGSNVDIQVEGEPINADRDWPMAIYVEKHTGNPDLSGDNVSTLFIDGGTNVNLISRDTAGVDAMSKGIVAWYAPVEIGSETAAANVTIDAEMAVYSVSDSLDNTNFNEGITFYDKLGGVHTLTSRDFTETEETGDYLHTLMDGDSYVGYATVGKSTAMSLDEFLAALAEAAANNEFYELTGTLIVDRDVELNGFGVTIGSGAEIIVKDGAVLTSNLNFEVSKDGKFTVEAGGRMVNQNSFIIEGTVSISDDGDYAGYVHNMPEGMLVGIYADGTDLPSVTGIPKKDCILQAKCNTEDQINYILGICGDYTETIIVPSADMVLNTMTIPEKVWLSAAPGITITVAEGAFLTLNGGLNIRNSTLIVNGKLINNVGMTFHLAEVTVNGTFENNNPTFINDSSVMTVNGILNNYAPLHVGFWKNTDTEGAAGTLNINGTLNNYDYLNISPDAQITEEDGSIRDCSGVVNVNEGGVLDNTFDESTKKSGFIENHGDLNIYGTMMNGQAVAQYGSLHLYGKLDNGGNIRLYDKVTDTSNALELVTYPGAELINNTMIGNFSRNGVITLAEGTYTQGSHTYKDGTTEPGELDAYYFDDQIMAQIQGAPEGMVSIFYEGSNAEALLAASEAYNWVEGYYDRCFLRVVGDMTFPAGKELNLAPGTYLVVLNNGNNYNGSLTVEGAIFNQSYIRLFGADMTIMEGGWITNKGTIETGDSGTSVTVCGLLENASTGTVDLSNAEFARFEPGVVQNNLAGGNLGSIAGIPVSEQTLFSDIADGGQARLQELVGMVQNDGYRNGFFWISKDLHITESTVLPGNVSLNVLDGAALTIDPGVVLQLDSWLVVDAGGNLNVNGILAFTEGTMDVHGTMTVAPNGQVSLGKSGQINVAESGSLINKGYFGLECGTINGNIDNRGTVSVTWIEGNVGKVNGSFLSGADRVDLYMPFNDVAPDHDEADIQTMLAYAAENNINRVTVHFTRDYTFENDFTVPQNMTFAVGAYGDEQNYRAATVTIPAGKTLIIDGSVQVAKKSALVIEGSMVQNTTGSFYASGSCGNNAEWVLNNGILTISGSGDMLDYAKDSAPWAGYASLIKSVKIDTGITGIGDNAFGNISVDSILVPRNVASVGENAFADGVTLKVYHESAAEAYAESYGHSIVYIHELDPETGACLYCDFGLEATLKDETKTTEEKVEEVKNTDTESLKAQIENEMTQDASGASDTMDLIEDLETQVKTDSGITVDAGVAPNANENISTTFQQVSDEAIVGAVLNAREDVTEVKLVISNPSGENEVSDEYDTDTGVVFSMTLEGVEDASSLDVPVKITLPVPAGIKDLSKLVVLHYHDGVEEVVNYTLSTGEDGKAYVSFLVSGFSDFAIVEEAEVEEFNCTFLQSTQLGLIEPWFLKSNLYLKNADGNFLTEAELNAFTDFGVYFIRASELGNPATKPTVEDIVSSPYAIQYSKNDDIHQATVAKGTSGYMITASYVEGIYTYELQDPVYVLFYVETASGRHYDTVKTRNLYSIADKAKTNTSFDETERTVYTRMIELENAITAHRATFESIPDMTEQTAPLITIGQFGNYQTGYSANHSNNIVLIEPWGIKLNGYVNNNVVLEDAGVVVFYDKNDQYATAPTVDELLSNPDTYVFSTENGNASVAASGNYHKIEAIYNKGIFTYQLNDNAYAAFFVKVDGIYHFCSVKTRNILSMIEKIQDNTTYPETERNVYKAMINMHYDVVTHRAKFGLS